MTAGASNVTGQSDPVQAWLHSNVPLFVRELLAGGAAGAVGKTAVAPLERTKILLMTGRSQAGAWATLRLILTSEGIPGLFRGNSASCLRIMPYAAIHFSVYEVYRRLLAEHIFHVHLPPVAPPQAPLPQAPAALTVPVEAGPQIPGPLAVPEAASEGTSLDEQPGQTAPMSLLSGPESRDLPLDGTQSLSQGLEPFAPLTSSIDVSTVTAITTAELLSSEQQQQQQQQQLRDGAGGARGDDDVKASSSGDSRAALPGTLLSGSRRVAAMGRSDAGGSESLSTTAPVLIGSALAACHSQQQPHRGPLAQSAILAHDSGPPGQRQEQSSPVTHSHEQHGQHHAGGQGHGQRQGQQLGPVGDLLAGSAAGATAVLMTYPLDIVRTRLAWSMDFKRAPSMTTAAAAAPAAAGLRTGAIAATATATAVAGTVAAPAATHNAHIVSMLVHIVRHEGLLGLYRGLAPTLYGIMPYAGLKFFVYSSLKQWYRETRAPSAKPLAGGAAATTITDGGRGRGGGERLPVPYMLAFGGASGLFAQTLTYPLDVVRRRMQVAGLQNELQDAAAGTAAAASRVGRMTTWGTAVAIVRNEGLRGLARGMSINYVKVVPSTAVGFTSYELFKSYLGVTGNL